MDEPVRPASRNRLEDERSPFLKHGAGQPVHWWPWSEDAFREARERSRPILLDIGAVWCHWCHVMDHESYEDEETAALINELYIPVKVDRDERPDVDARYQRAVQLLTGQGGWPLTAFLTPDGEVFFGGTYFPPVDGQGRPSFRRVLREVARVWTDDPERVADAIRSLDDRTRSFARKEQQDGAVTAAIVDQAVEALAETFDFRYGGFGRAPKFPNPAGLDLMLDRFIDRGEAWAGRIVEHTLHAMGRGGIHDQIGGGFHRYSTDAQWIIPHFEKMAYDNGPLLATCAAAAAALDDPYVASLAQSVIRHYRDIAPDLVERGGFPASQDADFGFDNDGDYWTWTADEMGAVLDDADDFDLASAAFGLESDAGRMHIDRTRHALFRALDDADLATRFGLDAADVARRLEAIASRLKQTRDRRPAPFVDTTLYSGWTALVAAGHIRAARHLNDAAAGDAGLRALERIWSEAFLAGEGVLHRVGGAGSGFVLEDQAYVLDACVDAFEYTQDPEWIARAVALVDVLAERFQDGADGALRDRSGPPGAVRSLDEPIYPITDAPTPSGNGAAALGLLRLAAHGSYDRARQIGDAVLRRFAGVAPGLLAGAATYTKAVAWAVLPVTSIVIVDDVGGPRDSTLLTAALRAYRPRTTVRLIAPADAAEAQLPDAIRGMLRAEYPRAYVCSGRTCAAPVDAPESLVTLMKTFAGD
jgi:uncharacterized protein YyaL (SSP411 family)